MAAKGMEPLKNIADSIPALKHVSSKLNIKSHYLLILFCFLTLALAQRTFLGQFLSTVLTVFLPVRDSILIARSPNPKPDEMRKLLVLYVVFALFICLESIGVLKIIPAFAFLKIAVIYWIGCSEDNANFVLEAALRKIPHEWLTFGDSIRDAVKAASKSLESKIEAKKDKIATSK